MVSWTALSLLHIFQPELLILSKKKNVKPVIITVLMNTLRGKCYLLFALFHILEYITDDCDWLMLLREREIFSMSSCHPSHPDQFCSIVLKNKHSFFILKVFLLTANALQKDMKTYTIKSHTVTRWFCCHCETLAVLARHLLYKSGANPCPECYAGVHNGTTTFISVSRDSVVILYNLCTPHQCVLLMASV